MQERQGRTVRGGRMAFFRAGGVENRVSVCTVKGCGFPRGHHPPLQLGRLGHAELRPHPLRRRHRRPPPQWHSNIHRPPRPAARCRSAGSASTRRKPIACLTDTSSSEDHREQGDRDRKYADAGHPRDREAGVGGDRGLTPTATFSASQAPTGATGAGHREGEASQQAGLCQVQGGIAGRSGRSFGRSARRVPLLHRHGLGESAPEPPAGRSRPAR